MRNELVRVAGRIFDATAEEIGRALAALAVKPFELATELEIEGEHFGFAIYPDQPENPANHDFLVGGTILLDIERARMLIATVCAALDERGIAFELELVREDRDELFRGKTSRAPGMNNLAVSSGDLDDGRIVLDATLRAGTGEEVRAGSFAADPSKRLLITQGGRHAASYDQLRARFALAHQGIGPLVYLGAAIAPFDDAIVESVSGSPARAPLAERELAVLGRRLAAIVARVHAAGEVLGGIRPELVYVDGDDVLLVPRGPAFLADTPLARGLRCYYVPYLAPEQVLANTLQPASDVFALCATLFFLGTAKHPFGDPERLSELVTRIITGASERWPGSSELGQILAAGMSVDAAARPTAAELAEQLANLG